MNLLRSLNRVWRTVTFQGPPHTPRSISSDEERRVSALDGIVKAYIANKMIDVPFVPDCLESHLYRGILEMLLECARDSLAQIDILGQKFKIEVAPLNADEIERIHAEITGMMRKKGYAKSVKDRKHIVEKLSERFVDNENIDIPFVPDFVEKCIYSNILSLVLGITLDTLNRSCVNFLGHRMSFIVATLPECLRHSLNSQQHDGTTKNVSALVDKYMEKHNVWILPDRMERHIYVRALLLLRAVLCEFLSSSSLTCFDHKISLKTTREDEDEDARYPPGQQTPP